MQRSRLSNCSNLSLNRVTEKFNANPLKYEPETLVIWHQLMNHTKDIGTRFNIERVIVYDDDELQTIVVFLPLSNVVSSLVSLPSSSPRCMFVKFPKQNENGNAMCVSTCPAVRFAEYDLVQSEEKGVSSITIEDNPPSEMIRHAELLPHQNKFMKDFPQPLQGLAKTLHDDFFNGKNEFRYLDDSTAIVTEPKSFHASNKEHLAALWHFVSMEELQWSYTWSGLGPWWRSAMGRTILSFCQSFASEKK